MREDKWFVKVTIFAILASAGCRTLGLKSGSSSSSPQSVSGVFDSNNQMVLPVPSDINNFTPPVPAKGTAASGGVKGSFQLLDSSANTIVPSVSPIGKQNTNPPTITTGKASTLPTSTSGIEEIVVKCYNNDDQFIAANWFFYAELEANGKIAKSYSQQPVNKCGQMQIVLKTLDINTSYIVRAAFYWQSPDQQQTIVWYEGETKPFKPSDQDRQLVLQRLRQDQVVNVDIQKSPKDQCILAGYLWNGQTCLNTYNAMSFFYADQTDYSSNASPRVRKCLHVGADKVAIEFSCQYTANEMVTTLLHGTEMLPDRDYGWFSIQFDGGETNYCLTAAKDPAGGEPILYEANCAKDLNSPPKEQLFTLIVTQAGDEGGRDSFRIASMFDGTARCISVPPEAGDVTGSAPIQDGAKVRLTSCDTTNLNIRKTQFIDFVTSVN